MAASPLGSPVVLDAIVSNEKLDELVGLQTEYPELDFKEQVDVGSTAGLVEFCKDVGAMQVRGGYIVIGVDGDGVPTGAMDGVDARLYDEANLSQKLKRYLPDPLEVRTRVLEKGGHVVVLVYVGRHPAGYAIFHTDGQYERNGKPYIAFRAGDSFWRDGTRSVRITQPGMEEIIERRLAEARATWLQEQQEIRRQDRAEVEAAFSSRSHTTSTLGSANFDLAPDELRRAVLELVRVNDSVALTYLFTEAIPRARASISRDDIETELADMLDKLVCVAAALMQYEQRTWLLRAINTFARIYSLPLGPNDARRFGFSVDIDPSERAPRVWFQIITRIYGLGAFAVRLQEWETVRALTLQHPEKLTGYDSNWLRHAMTMVSRAQHLGERQTTNLISLARAEVARLECLRADGLSTEDEDADEVLTSVAQFDLLSNLVAIDGAGDSTRRVFFPSFARFRQERIQPIANRVLTDSRLRQNVFPRTDAALALAFHRIGEAAAGEGMRYDGFDGWLGTPVGEFVAASIEPHLLDE